MRSLSWFDGEYPMIVSVYIFVKRALKQWDILTSVVEPLNQTMFQNGPWIFQQNFTPAHKAKTMQQCLENPVPEFISSDH